MSWSLQNLSFYVLVLTALISSTACSAWIIEPNDSCTWGIPNGDLPIPADYIPVGAMLTLHNVSMDTSAAIPMLAVYLLHNPDPGLVKLAASSSYDPFEGCGIALSVFSQPAAPGQDLIVDLAQVNDLQSSIGSVFSIPFTQTLGNQDTVTYSSAMLELLDYSGSGRSFGFGFYSQGFVCSAMTLQISVQSLTEAAAPQIITFSTGNLNDPPTWNQILYDDFESGMGNWIDGGTHCMRYKGSSHAHQGRAALDLQGNTDTSVASTDNLALSGHSAIKVDFWYKCVSMDSASEDFWLQISTNGGSTYTTVEEWNPNDEFVNDRFYQESVTITGYTLTDQTRLRFRCDAGAKDDDVYIDQIAVSVQ